jgi:uncharacterized protein (DUF1810 family)
LPDTRDLFNLQRFVEAQNPGYSQVLSELRAGRKRSHWMWYIFPQMKGLGHSETARFYGIASRQEAEAYLAHPVLGARLCECTALMNRIEGSTVEQILGYPDDLKFRSSMTLFAAVADQQTSADSPSGHPFQAALDKFFDGKPDPSTLNLL